MDLGPIRLWSGLGAVRLTPDADFFRGKTAVTELRWPLVVAAMALLLCGAGTWTSLVIAALMLLSNLALRRLPDSTLAAPTSDLAVIVLDTLLLSAGFLAGGFGSEFFVAYFFVVFLAGVADSLASVILGSLLASLVYLGADLQTGAALPRGLLAVRVLFLFSVALCYGGLVERARREQEQRRAEGIARLESTLAELQYTIDLHTAATRTTFADVRASIGALIGYLDLARHTIHSGTGNGDVYVDKAGQRAERIRHLTERELGRIPAPASDVSNPIAFVAMIPNDGQVGSGTVERTASRD